MSRFDLERLERFVMWSILCGVCHFLYSQAQVPSLRWTYGALEIASAALGVVAGWTRGEGE